MLFKNTICPKCGSSYEPSNPTCPHCGEDNPNPDSHKKQRGITWLPYWQEILFFLVGWIGLNMLTVIMQFVFVWLYDKTNETPFLAAVTFTSYGLLFIGLLFLLWNKYQIVLKPFKKWLPYLVGVGIGVGMLLVSSAYSSLVSQFTKVTDNENQNTIVSITKAYPALSIIFFAFIGPICEELTYRLGCFSFLARTKKWIAYLVCALIFGLIHFNFFAGSADGYINELWNLPSYMIAGAILCFTYDYFGLSASISAHIVNNLISVVMILVVNE